MTIKTLGRLSTEKDFRDLIIREDARGIVRLSDVAKVELGPEQYEQSWRLNGVSAVGHIYHSSTWSKLYQYI